MFNLLFHFSQSDACINWPFEITLMKQIAIKKINMLILPVHHHYELGR